MKKYMSFNPVVSAVVMALMVLALPLASLMAQTRTEKPNDFTLELGGRFYLYSLSYQRMLGPMAGLEFGLSYFGGATEGEGFGVFFLSGGARIYVTKKDASPCLAAGIVYLTAGTDVGPFGEDSESLVYFFINPGFEYRMSGGFLFRGGVNFLIKDGFFVRPGLSLGVAF